MSRRREFDTSLTASAEFKSKSQPNKTNNPRSPKKKQAAIQASTSSSSGPRPHAVAAEVGEDAADGSGRASQTAETVDESVGDEGICFICAEPITFWSVGACGHRTCHVCAVRLRTFYKKFECTYCKTVTPSLLFSHSPTAPFPREHHLRPSPPQRIQAASEGADKLPRGQQWFTGLTLPGALDLEEFEFHDEKLGVVFEDEDMMEATLLLLRFNCPAPDCAHMAVDWPALEKHTMTTHGALICRLCRSQLHRFAHEQVLYPPHLIMYHDPSRLKRGQSMPRSTNKKDQEIVRSWEAPHPMCEFCHDAFFGVDELFSHMRDRHEECFVCKGAGQRDVYFRDYPKLEQHFRQDHFPCNEPQCLVKKFVVFNSEMDLQAHMIEDHREQMTSRDRAQARTLHVDFQSYGNANDRRPGPSRQDRSGRGFSIQTSQQVNGTIGHDDRRGAQQQQLSSSVSMTPEAAAQHARQLNTDRQEDSRRRKAFVTSLTDGIAGETSGAGSGRDHDLGGRSGFATPREDVDDASAQRHGALLSRVTMLVNESTVKLASFRSAVRQYRNNESSASDMVDTVFHVLDRDMDATTSVVREVASFFDAPREQEKQSAILEALNAFRVKESQQKQFPALQGPTGLGSNWAGITSGKILNAKRTTHTAGRGSSSQNLWDRVEAAASSPRPTAGVNGRFVPGAGLPLSSSSAFPTLAPPASSTVNASRGPLGHSTPWSSGGAGPSSRSPSALASPQIRSVNYPTPAVSKAKAPTQSAFPSLPSSKPAMTRTEREALFKKPNAREVTAFESQPTPSASEWGSSRGVAEGMDGLTMGETPGGGGRKKKGKQLLYAVSARP